MTATLDSIQRAALRLNPCLDLDVDVVVVEAGAAASDSTDWTTGTLTNVTVAGDGTVSLTPSGTVSIFSQTTSHSVKNSATHASLPGYTWLDFFPDPAVFQGPIELNSVTLWLGTYLEHNQILGSFSGTVTILITRFDDRMVRHNLTDPITIPSSQITTDGGAVTIPLANKRIVISPAMVRVQTGPGRTNAGALRTVGDQGDGVSHIDLPQGFSIGVTAAGWSETQLFLGCADNAAVANFDTTAFWRVAPNRNHGPYNPTDRRFSPLDTNHNTDGNLVTGAVPGYGAQSVTNGARGLSIEGALDARQPSTGQPWAVPYHDVTVRTYPASGTVVNTLDLGRTPTQDVELHMEDVRPGSTSIAYTLHASSDNFSASDITIGTVQDGDVIRADGVHRLVGGVDTLVIAGTTFRQRYYRLTATLTPAGGATKYATPVLRSWSVTARRTFQTFKYLGDLDYTTSVDPANGESEIGELTMPMYRITRDARDLATQIASQYAPQNVELRVYAVNRRTGDRYYLNSFRLEQRDPGFYEEKFTALAGLDRLKVTVPPKREQGTGIGTYTIASVSTSGSGPVTVTIGVTGTPFQAGGMAPGKVDPAAGAWRCFVAASAVSGLAGQSFPILTSPANTTSAFAIQVRTTTDVPHVGDTIEVHSDWFARVEQDYSGQDFAAVYDDLITNQAQVPARLIGRKPATTGRTTLGRLQAQEERTAKDVLQEIAYHCGGFLAWEGGQIHFADLFAEKDAVVQWDERHIVSLETPMGMDRRMPIVDLKYDYDFGAGAFKSEAQWVDVNAFTGYGLANLFDITKLPDSFCQWNDQAEAQYIANLMLTAFAAGVMVWKVKTVFAYPWLRLGDCVAITTDQFTGRVVQVDPNGVDTGRAIGGRTRTTGIIVGKDIWGQSFSVCVRGFQSITTSTVGAGAIGGPFDDIPIPSDFAVSANVQGDPGASATWLLATWTRPASPYFDHMEYSVAARRTGDPTFGAPTTVVGTRGGHDRIIALPGTDVRVTPVTVTTAGHRFAGASPVTVTVPAYAPPAPTITPAPGASAITYHLTLDPATRYVRWWHQAFASDPGNISVENLGTEGPRIDAGSGMMAVTGGALNATTPWEAATFVPYDANNTRGTPIRFHLQRDTSASVPPAPTAASNVSVTATTVTNSVTMPGDVSNIASIRTYRNGAVFGSDTALSVGGGGAQSITHSGLMSGELDSWQYSTVSPTGIESATKTTAFSTTTSSGTIPTPSISTVFYDTVAQAFTVVVSPAPGTPSGVTWHLKTGTVNPPTAEDTSAASTSTTLVHHETQEATNVTVYFLVWGVKSGWTNSANSAVVSCVKPRAGGGV